MLDVARQPQCWEDLAIAVTRERLTTLGTAADAEALRLVVHVQVSGGAAFLDELVFETDSP